MFEPSSWALMYRLSLLNNGVRVFEFVLNPRISVDFFVRSFTTVILNQNGYGLISTR